jgi:hypothetical protein
MTDETDKAEKEAGDKFAREVWGTTRARGERGESTRLHAPH